MSQPAARLGDSHNCPKEGHDNGVLKKGGASSVLIEGKPAARVGDLIECSDGSLQAVTEGSTCVLIEGKRAARMGDPTEHGGAISSGASNVFIGTGGNTSVYIGKNVHIGGAPGKRVFIGGKTLPVTPEAPLKVDWVQLDYHYYDGAERTVAVSNIKDETQLDNPPRVSITDSAHQKKTTPLAAQGQAAFHNVASGSLDPIDNAGLHIIEVNGQPHDPWEPVKLTNSEPLCKDPSPDKAHTFQLTAVWPFIHLDYRTFYNERCRHVMEDDNWKYAAYSPESIEYFKKQAEEYLQEYEQSKPPSADLHLRPEHIRYFQTNGNNVTLFIHGYNVHQGTLGFKTKTIKPVSKLVNEFDLTKKDTQKLIENTGFKVDKRISSLLEPSLANDKKDLVSTGMKQVQEAASEWDEHWDKSQGSKFTSYTVQLVPENGDYSCTLLRTYEDMRKNFPELPEDIRDTTTVESRYEIPGSSSPPPNKVTSGVPEEEERVRWDSALNGFTCSLDERDPRSCCAYNWALHMEYNLNCAGTGQYPFDWKQHGLQYTRLLHVFWPGDLGDKEIIQPEERHSVNEYNTAVHYPRAERHSAIPCGLALTYALKQLHTAGIKINIIAHSLGNRVLLAAMQLLAEGGLKDCLEHVFMWEPALPQTALTPGQGPIDKGLFPRANEAAQHISVFSSLKDSVLEQAYPSAKGYEEAKYDEHNHPERSSFGYTNSCLYLNVLNECNNQPPDPNDAILEQPAMGYKGPDEITKNNLKSKLTWYDQEKGRICPGHSVMRIPSKELFNKVYVKRILGAKNYCFGKYPPPPS